MSYDYDGRWHDDDVETWGAFFSRMTGWALLVLALIILTGIAYNAGLFENERPNHQQITTTTTIVAPGHG